MLRKHFKRLFFSYIVLNVNSLKFVSINNQECKVRPEIININSHEPSFYPYSVKISKCSGSCNNIEWIWSIFKNMYSWCC